MKSYNNLYDKMLEKNLVKTCFITASEKKRDRKDVQKVLSDLDAQADILIDILENEEFIPSFHELSIINEGSNKKTRRILKPTYKYEQVVHHCIVGQFGQIVMNGLYEFTCGSIPGRGVHYGKKYMRKWIDSYKGEKFYVFKMDIYHFFESIDRKILKKMLKDVIRDKRFLRLLYITIEHNKVANIVKMIQESRGSFQKEKTKELATYIAYDQHDKAIELLHKNRIHNETIEEEIKKDYKGVPLGYYTSQWHGNFLLKKLDHYIKEILGAEHYMRYMDDIVILGRNKKKLHKIHKAVEKYLNENLNLKIKEDWQVFRFEYPIKENGKYVLDKKGKIKTKGRMLDFMGFQFHWNRTTIRKRNLKSTQRKADHIAKDEKTSWYNAAAMLSYMGMFKHTDTYGYYLNHIKPIINIKKLKRIVSKHSRKEQRAYYERLEKSNRITGDKTGTGRSE